MTRIFSALVTVLGGLLLVAMCSAVQAQEPRQARITLIRPTLFTDGTPIPAGTVITYNLYQGECGASKPKVAEIAENGHGREQRASARPKILLAGHCCCEWRRVGTVE